MSSASQAVKANHITRSPRATLGSSIALAGALALLGCGAQGRGEDTSPATQVVSWDEFKTAVARNIDGKEIYVVEWDQAVTEAELRQRYDDYVNRTQAREAGLGETEQSSVVNEVSGGDDIWRNGQQANLTYCVSDSFGADKSRVVSEMAQAAAAWQQAAAVRFAYLSDQDASCTGANTRVTFAVVPWIYGGACSFLPSGGGCVARSLVINLRDLDTSYHTIAPNVRTVGVLRHELGHILGLRHEHTRAESGACFEDSSWRALTSYDRDSVMHYPWCNGVMTSDMSLTSSDIAGVVALYHRAWALALRPAPADYDGDGKADFSVVDDQGVWYVAYAKTGFSRWDVVRSGYGGSHCVPVPADYDGDGKADFSVQCVDASGIGTWFVDYASSPQDGWDVIRSGYGGSHCVPVPADYDGDGKADFSVRCVDARRGSLWFVDYASSPQEGWDVIRRGHGDASCHPVPADYDGDGKADYSVKCDCGTWFVDYTSTPGGGWDVIRSGYGDGSGIPVPADYDGDGKADFSVKGADGTWYIDFASSPQDGWNAILPGYGGSGVTPVPADYDGDHRADLSVIDKRVASSSTTNPTWYVDHAPSFGGWDAIVTLPAFPSP